MICEDAPFISARELDLPVKQQFPKCAAPSLKEYWHDREDKWIHLRLWNNGTIPFKIVKQWDHPFSHDRDSPGDIPWIGSDVSHVTFLSGTRYKAGAAGEGTGNQTQTAWHGQEARS